MMIIISWNIRGLNARVKKSSLRKLISRHDPKFIFLQETKMESLNPKTIRSIWNSDDIDWLFIPSIGNSGGLLSMWKIDYFSLTSHKSENNWIALNGKIPSKNFQGVLVNVYNPCCRVSRSKVWTSISDYWAESQSPMLMVGDFNEVLDPSDRGSGISSQLGVLDFKNFIQQTHLMEISASDGWFTWFSGQAKSKLDRLLVNPEWVSLFPSLQVSILRRNLSDHCPLLVKSDELNWGPRPFRFQNCWLSHPGCLQIIKDVWASHTSGNLTDKLKETKKRLKIWNSSEFGHIDRNIEELEDRIHSLDLISNGRDLQLEELAERRSAQMELWVWLRRKEAFWAQNSRAKWIKEGDKNTKYFHTLASIRKKKNTIPALITNNGVVSDPAGIHHEAVSFFKSIFKEDFSSRPVFNGLQFRSLSCEQVSQLTEPFSHKEVDEAVESCDPQKAPGPDGYNFRFIKDSWEIIKLDVYNIVENFWNSGSLPKGSNVAFIALIAKREVPEGLNDFRPISMVGCIYKIIAKLLARRLQKVMDSLIGPYQSSFIAGRQILDGALIAGELIDTCRRKKVQLSILKLDFHKAFDSVAWSFLDWTLDKMGFPPRWRMWISSCITSAAASILINGSPTAPFKLHRGLRQGDPLSPFLFDLVVETLSLVIQKASHLGLWEGVEVTKNGEKITHLQYADDTIIFCPPNLDYLLNIKKTLILFQLASGLQVNFHKSSIMGIHVDEIWLQEAANALLCKVGRLPFTYLGLPIGGNISRLAHWDPIIKKIEGKLASWKGRMLSIAGRITLIKASISSLPLYYMSLFPAPRGVIEAINKLQRNFLWSGELRKSSLALVAWNQVVLPKESGGLNCGNLLNRNISLLFKWIWRLSHDPESLWQKVIKEKYGYSHTTTVHDLCTPKGSGPWRFICASILNHPSARSFVKTKLRKAVGNGVKTLFWLDTWLGDSPLKLRFPRLFTIVDNPMAYIASCGSWCGREWVWNFSWSRVFRPRDAEEWEELQGLLGSVCLSPSTDDRLIWTPHKSGAFSVKSCSKELTNTALKPQSKIRIWGRLWRGLIPPRIEVFSWVALLGKLNSRQKLATLNIIPPDDAVCIMCNGAPETSDHLLLHCPFASSIWLWWLGIWNVSWVFPKNLFEAFEQWYCHKKNPFFRKVWCSIFSIIIWTIWKERNARIFRGISCSSNKLQDLVIIRLMWWIKGWGEAFPYSIVEVLRHPQCLSWDYLKAAPAATAVSVDGMLWSPPNDGVMKWNVDASVNAGRSAIGGVLRNSQGIFVCVFSCPIPSIEINSAEIIAIYRAMQICYSFEFLKRAPLVLESDSANAVMWSNENEGGPWNLNFQLNFIRNARKAGLNISIVHKKRSSNAVADALAKQGLSRTDDFLAWL